MSETIKELLKRKIDNANDRLKEKRAWKEKAVSELIAKCDREINHEEGRIAALENLEDLNWIIYANNTISVESK